MFKVLLNNNQRVIDVFDTDRYVENNVSLVEITAEEHAMIAASGFNGDFKMVDGKIVYDPEIKEEGKT